MISPIQSGHLSDSPTALCYSPWRMATQIIQPQPSFARLGLWPSPEQLVAPLYPLPPPTPIHHGPGSGLTTATSKTNARVWLSKKEIAHTRRATHQDKAMYFTLVHTAYKQWAELITMSSQNVDVRQHRTEIKKTMMPPQTPSSRATSFY